jgi:hypothetical protein
MTDSEGVTSTDDNEHRTHHLMLGNRWGDRAEENIEKWGNQPPKMLLLAMAEEMAEVANELLEHGGKPPNAHDSEAESLLNDIRTVGFRARKYLERECEDDDGNPLPAKEYPDIHGAANPERGREEVEDVAPLCWQLYWKLGEFSSKDSVRSSTDSEQT